MSSTGRILIAEDMDANAVLFRAVLERAGHAVDVAVDGREAVVRAGRHAFPLILMDVGLPIMDGLQATREIRASACLSARALIVALTADHERSMERACAEAGMDFFLTKPISPSVLAAKAAELVALGRARLDGATPELGPQRRIA